MNGRQLSGPAADTAAAIERRLQLAERLDTCAPLLREAIAELISDLPRDSLDRGRWVSILNMLGG